MNELFTYPEFADNGVKTVSRQDGPMMMDIEIWRLRAGERRTVSFESKEAALLLITGRITFFWNGNEQEAARGDIFTDRPWCLHIPAGACAEVAAQADSELLVQSAENSRPFEQKLYRPEDCDVVQSKYDQWETTAKRDIVTIFDYSSAPYSNLVLGEVLHYPGRWSSYIPHSHEQPEVYFYKFDKPQGFGACFIGENVFKIKDGSACHIPGGLTHPQVTAPGYRMYYVWMIRHLPDNPWTDRIDEECHKWLLDQE